MLKTSCLRKIKGNQEEFSAGIVASQVGLAESRRSRVNVIGAPRETLVTNVGGFRIPNRLLKSLPYPVFRIAAVPRGFTQRVSYTTAPLSKDSPGWRFV